MDKRFVEREIQCDGVIERSEVIVYSGADTVAADFEKFFIQNLKRRTQLACCLCATRLRKIASGGFSLGTIDCRHCRASISRARQSHKAATTSRYEANRNSLHQILRRHLEGATLVMGGQLPLIHRGSFPEGSKAYFVSTSPS